MHPLRNQLCIKTLLACGSMHRVVIDSSVLMYDASYQL